MLKKYPNIKNLLLFFLKSTYIFVGVVIILVIFSTLFVYTLSKTGDNLMTPRNYSVIGEASKKVKPDKVNISLSTNILGKDVREVQKKSADVVNKAVEEIKKLGIDEAEIQTSNFNITPIYTNPYNYMELYKNEIKEYSSVITLTVKTGKIDKLSDILDVSTNAGMNQVSNLYFYNENAEAINQEVKLLAIDNAKAKAQEVAKKSGLTLGKLFNVQEGYNYNPYSYPSMVGSEKAMDTSAVRETIKTTIESGENEVKQTITLVYEIL